MYKIVFMGNRLEQFNSISFDVFLKDDECIKPDYRTTREYPAGTSEVDIMMDVFNLYNTLNNPVSTEPIVEEPNGNTP